MKKHTVNIGEQSYQIDILRQSKLDNNRVKVIVPIYAVSDDALQLVRVCIESIRKYADGLVDIWVVDNNSPVAYSEKFKQLTGVNLIQNKTEPLEARYPRNKELIRKIRNLFGQKGFRRSQLENGSYANAVAVELALAVLREEGQYVLTMHSDAVMTRSECLPYFESKMSDTVKAVGYRQDPGRARALHVAGLFFDYKLVRSLGGTFFPSTRRDGHDVGDLVSIVLKSAGYEYFVCRNTFNQPELVFGMSKHDPYREFNVDRAFDDEGNVIFAHLGRGTSMVSGGKGNSSGLTVGDWVKYADEYVL